MRATIPIAAETADGGVIVHQVVVRGARPTDAEIAQSLNRAGLGACKSFAVISLADLPSREHRDAWVIRNGRVEIDPMRIKVQQALAPAPGPKRMVFQGSVFAQPDPHRLALAVGLANTAIAVGGLAGDLRWHGGKANAYVLNPFEFYLAGKAIIFL